MPSSEGSVIIVGGGPVGLAAALILGSAGVKVMLFEQGDIAHQEPRATTLHAATLDQLDDLGVYQRIEPLGLICPTVRYWNRASGALIAEFDHAVLAGDVRHPWVLQCEQDKLARVIGEMLRDVPTVTLHIGAKVVACSQTADGVSAQIRLADGTDLACEADYLIGADGARSTVREQIEVAFEGFTYPERFLIVSTPFDFQDHRGYAYRNYIFDPEEWATLFKISWTGPPGVWRLVTPARPGETADDLRDPATAQARLQRFLPQAEPYDVPFFKWYTVDQRVAARFRAGRILLAGDAAHLNNPLGAMGLNSGLHDAVNLCDALISVLRGGPDAALDRYERQRRHVAVTHVQAATQADKQNLEQRDPDKRQRYFDDLSRMATTPDLARRYMQRASLVESLRDAASIA